MVRLCDAPLTIGRKDGIKRLRLIILIKHFALDLFNEIYSHTHGVIFFVFHTILMLAFPLLIKLIPCPFFYQVVYIFIYRAYRV
jgi:hypothetical protein